VVSKYVDGCDLATRIRAERLSASDAVNLVATIASALHYADSQGVVHRDVRPGNILIDRDGNVRDRVSGFRDAEQAALGERLRDLLRE